MTKDLDKREDWSLVKYKPVKSPFWSLYVSFVDIDTMGGMNKGKRPIHLFERYQDR